MKKINLVTSQGKKMMCCAELIVLTQCQYEKLTDYRLAKQVDAIAKDLKVDWSIDVVATEKKNILNITRTTPNVIDDEFYHDLEMAADNFMSAIDKLQLEAECPLQLGPECPSHESDKIEDLEFVKTLLNDMNLPSDNDRHVIGALIIDTTTHPFCPELTGWGRMSHDLLKEMCELYLEKHGEK